MFCFSIASSSLACQGRVYRSYFTREMRLALVLHIHRNRPAVEHGC